MMENWVATPTSVTTGVDSNVVSSAEQRMIAGIIIVGFAKGSLFMINLFLLVGCFILCLIGFVWEILTDIGYKILPWQIAWVNYKVFDVIEKKFIYWFVYAIQEWMSKINQIFPG